MEKIIVSSRGYCRLRQTRAHYAAPTKGKLDPNGYAVVTVDKKPLRVHRLVCMAWHGVCPSGYSCDHINGDRSDNNKDNLRWSSVAQQRENQKIPSKKRWDADAVQSDLPGERWVTLSTAMKLSNMGRVQFKKKHHPQFSAKRTVRPAAGMAYARVNNKALHRLVYEAFCGRIPEGCTIDHINQDKSDNRLSNLRAITPSEQNLNRTWRSSSNRQTALKKPVKTRLLQSDVWEEFDSLSAALKEHERRMGLKFNSGCASNVACGRQVHHRGVVFSYE